MEPLLDYALLANLFLVLFFLIYEVFLRRETHFSWSRYYLLAALVLSFLIPLVELPETATQTAQEAAPLPPLRVDVLIPPPEATTSTETALPAWVSVLVGVYLLGVGVRLWYFLGGLGRILALARRYPLLRKSGYWEITLPEGTPPFSFLNLLFWPTEHSLSEAEAQQIRRHEQVHIREWHSLDILLSECVKTVFWFNPVGYAYQNALRHLHEYLADAKATQNTPKSNYAELLLRQFLEQDTLYLSNQFFNTKLLKQRIMKLNQIPSHPSARLKVLWAIPVLALALFVQACSEDVVPLQRADSRSYTKIKSYPLSEGKTTTYKMVLAKGMDYKISLAEGADISEDAVQFAIQDTLGNEIKSNRSEPPFSDLYYTSEEVGVFNLQIKSQVNAESGLEVAFSRPASPQKSTNTEKYSTYKFATGNIPAKTHYTFEADLGEGSQLTLLSLDIGSDSEREIKASDFTLIAKTEAGQVVEPTKSFIINEKGLRVFNYKEIKGTIIFELDFKTDPYPIEYTILKSSAASKGK